MKAGKDYIGLGCGCLITNAQREVLLVRRSRNSKIDGKMWSQPGGQVEFGEKVEDAVRRELKEELGIEVGALEFLCYTDVIQTHGDTPQHWLSLSFSGKIISGEPVVREPMQHDAVRWFALGELPKDITQYTRDSLSAFTYHLFSACRKSTFG